MTARPTHRPRPGTRANLAWFATGILLADLVTVLTLAAIGAPS